MAYKNVDFAKFNKAQEQAHAAASRGEGWKPKIGKPGSPVRNRIRIMPMHVNMENPFVHVKTHFSLGPNKDKSARCLAPWSEECPADVWIDETFRTFSDPELAKEFKREHQARDRYGMQIVDLDHPEAGVQPWWFGPGEADKLGPCFKDDDGNDRDITDPQTGRGVIILGEYHPTKKFKNKPVAEYTFKAMERAEPLMDMSWLNDIKDLSEATKKPTRQDILDALAGKDRQRGGSSTPPAGKPGTPIKPPTAPVSAPASAPTPAAETLTAPKTAKRPVADDDADPFAAARAFIAAAGTTQFVEIKPEDVAEKEKKAPDCYAPVMIKAGKELKPDIADPKDSTGCCKCRLFLPCLTAKLAAQAAA